MRLFGKKRSRLQDIRIMNELFPASDAAAAVDGIEKAGAEYLVIAALDLTDDGSARRAFERIGADPDGFAPAVRAQHAEALRSIGMRPVDDRELDRYIPTPSEEPRFPCGAPSAHELFRNVVENVREEGSQLYGAYIVLAAAETEFGTTARALRHMGIDRSELAAAARAEIQAVNERNH